MPSHGTGLLEGIEPAVGGPPLDPGFRRVRVVRLEPGQGGAGALRIAPVDPNNWMTAQDAPGPGEAERP